MVQECISTLGKHQNSRLGRCLCCLLSGCFWQSVSNGVASLSLSCWLSVNVLRLNVVVSNGVASKSSLLSGRFWQSVSNGVASLSLSCWLSVHVFRLNVVVSNGVASLSLSCWLPVCPSVRVSNGVAYKSSLLSGRFWQLVSNGGVASLSLSCRSSVNVLRLNVGVDNDVASVVASVSESVSGSLVLMSVSESQLLSLSA